MRAFIALTLPQAFADESAVVANELKERVEGRYEARDNYHVTLAFVGDLKEEELRDAQEAVEAACKGLKATDLIVRELEINGRSHDATVWLRVSRTPEIKKMAKRVREELSRRAITFEDKPFKPHVTLVRRARLGKEGLPEIAQLPADSRGTHVAICRGVTSNDGRIYEEICGYDLA